MSKRYLMGIDNGGTFVKAVIFDERGTEIGSAAKKLRLIQRAERFAERDMEELWEDNCQVIREAIAKAGVPAEQIAGIACSGHGKGLYLWGKDDRPAYYGIVSTDTRAFKQVEDWERAGVPEKIFAKTCQKILACQPVSLLKWLQENEPAVMGKIRWVFEVKDYIRFRLTGEAFAEITDYSGSNLMNIKDISFDRDILETLGIAELYDALPPIKKSTDACGCITAEVAGKTGLRAGTVVAGGMFDIDSGALGMNVVNEDYLAIIAGTWSINEYISKQPVLNKSIMMNSRYCIPEYFLIEECSPTSAGNNEWFTSVFLTQEQEVAKQRGVSVYEVANEMAARVRADEQEIMFLPHIYGSNYNPKAKGCFIGFESHHTREHFVRAVLEGVAFCHKVHIEKLLSNKRDFKAARLAGGVTNSALWVQIFADVLNMPVEIIDTKEIGALGCAMVAAVTAGIYATVQEAGANMVKVRHVVQPGKDVAAYQKKFALYQRVAGLLDPVW